VLRGGQPQSLPSDRIVPGDVVQLSAGSLIPADGVVLEAHDFFVNQAVLTGETFPAEKKPGTVPANAGLAERTNCVFMGTSVGSGAAKALSCRRERGRSSVRSPTGCWRLYPRPGCCSRRRSRAHEPVQTDAEAAQQISRGIAADQRIRAEHEKQEGLDSEQQDAGARSDDGGRYYWWWPFRR
jgi:hypothetical protein